MHVRECNDFSFFFFFFIKLRAIRRRSWAKNGKKFFVENRAAKIAIFSLNIQTMTRYNCVLYRVNAIGSLRYCAHVRCCCADACATNITCYSPILLQPYAALHFYIIWDNTREIDKYSNHRFQLMAIASR